MNDDGTVDTQSRTFLHDLAKPMTLIRDHASNLIRFQPRTMRRFSKSA